MKKTFVLVLALIFVLGLAGSAFAAANPFVDVPAKHWAYDAISKLAKDGIVDGFGDGTFRGDQTMTRYQMAQIVAKAMAYQGKINAEQKALIDKLSVEFSTELQNLGVRVSDVESKINKMPKFNGEIRNQFRNDSYTNDWVKTAATQNGYTESQGIDAARSAGYQVDTNKQNWMRLRLYLTGNINDHWTYNARFAAYSDAQYGYTNASPGNNGNLNTYQGSNGVVRFDYGYVKGDYKNWKFYLGKFESLLPFSASQGTNDGGFGINPQTGMINDSWLTGVRVAYNSDKFKVNVYYGSEENPGMWDPTTNVYTSWANTNPGYATDIQNASNATRNSPEMYGIDLGYAFSDKFNFYLSTFTVNSGNGSVVGLQGANYINYNGQASTMTANQAFEKKNASFFEAGLDYKLSKQILFSGFVGGSNAKYDNNAWTARLDWSNSGLYKADTTKQGSWGAYVYYQSLGRYSTWVPTYDVFNINGLGSRGWTLGVNYVPFQNTLLNIEYSSLTSAQNANAAGFWNGASFGSTNNGTAPGDGASMKKFKVTFDYFF